MNKIKKFFIGIVALVLTITSSVLLFGCNSSVSLSFAKAYDYSAIAGVGILKNQTDEGGASQMSVRQTTLDNEQKEQIINSLAISQSFTSENFVKTAIVASDREGFDYLYTITTTNYAGARETYTFYYSQVDVSDPEDVRENETEYRLNGLIILDGVEYEMINRLQILFAPSPCV